MKWNFDPVLISFGEFSIHWYGVIFAAAIAIGFHLTKFMFSVSANPTTLYFYKQ